MTGLTQLRLAALCAFAYGLLLVSGLLHHFQRTGSLRALVHGLLRAELWIVLLVALLVTSGLWARQSWAWWLALAAAVFQLFRICSAYYAQGLGRVPGTTTLIALALLLLVLVLIAPRKARLAANR